MEFRKYQVTRIDTIVDGVAIYFEKPSGFEYQAGQYVNIELELDGNKVRRAYSLFSNPSEEFFGIAVKRVEGGLVSNWICDHARVGEQISLSTPEGRFVFNDERVGLHGFFAAGSGITPILSMVKQALKINGNKVVLYYGNKAENSTFFYKELIALKNTYPDNFQLELLFSRESISGAHQGRIDRNLLVNALRHEINLSFEPDFYMCGPSAMMETIEDTLKSYRIPESKIHLEYFETKSLEEPTEDLGEEFEVNYTVTLDDETETFSASSKINALDASIEAGMDAPFSCKGGVCSSCIAKVEKGSMNMVINHVLTDGEVEEGLVLTCQSHAKTKDIHLNFDV